MVQLEVSGFRVKNRTHKLAFLCAKACGDTQVILSDYFLPFEGAQSKAEAKPPQWVPVRLSPVYLFSPQQLSPVLRCRSGSG